MSRKRPTRVTREKSLSIPARAVALITRVKNNPYWIVALTLFAVVGAVLSIPDKTESLYAQLRKWAPQYAARIDAQKEEQRRKSILCTPENTVFSGRCDLEPSTGRSTPWQDWIVIPGTKMEIATFWTRTRGKNNEISLVGIEDGVIIFDEPTLECWVGCQVRAKVAGGSVFILVTAPSGGSSGGNTIAGWRVTSIGTLVKLPFYRLSATNTRLADASSSPTSMIIDDVAYAAETLGDTIIDSSFFDFPDGFWGVEFADYSASCEELSNGKCEYPRDRYVVRLDRRGMLLIPRT